MSAHSPTALIADDEPLLRRALIRQLTDVWPTLKVIAQARNGREAITLFETHQPDICFLDVHMPGLSGVEAARQIGRRAHLVFVTAFNEYAVQAFEHGALDYLVKPVEIERLKTTVERLQERLRSPAITPDLDAVLTQLAAQLQSKATSATALRWLRASIGNTVRLIAVDEIDYLRSDEKYTVIAWRDGGKPAEAVIRTPLKDLLTQLDASQFAQVHRSVVVNLNAISHIIRGDNETATIHLRSRSDTLPVSRSYLPRFRQM